MTTTTNTPPMAPGLRSIEAEQCVLGGLLLDASRWADVSAIVDADAFSHSSYRAIWRAIADVVAERREVDIVTVHDRLSILGLAEDVGGMRHLNELAECVPSAAGAVRYAGIVADRAKRRAMLAAVDGASELVIGADNADAALGELQARLGALQRTGARSVPKRLGELAAKRLQQVQEVAEGRAVPGMATGLAKLDAALGGGIRPGQVVVLAARPSVGKTSLALQLLLSVSERQHSGLMLSQEMTGVELAGRALSHTGGVRMDRLASATELESWEWAAIVDQTERMAGLPVWVDDQPALRLVDIAAKARDVKREAGGKLGLLVVDYLQLCAAEAPGKGAERSRHHQIEALSRGIKALAKELDCGVLLLSQLNRAAEDGEPELWHLKESGAVEEDADVVLLMHPAGMVEGTQTICLKVAKNRGGRRGRLALAFDGRTQRWESSNADVSRRGRGQGADE